MTTHDTEPTTTPVTSPACAAAVFGGHVDGVAIGKSVLNSKVGADEVVFNTPVVWLSSLGRGGEYCALCVVVREESGSDAVIVGLAALVRDNGEDNATALEDGVGRVVPFVSEKMRVTVVLGVTIDIVKSAAAGVGNAVAMRDEVEDCEGVNGSTDDCWTTYDDVCEITF
jgi:hypothetical protein